MKRVIFNLMIGLLSILFVSPAYSQQSLIKVTGTVLDEQQQALIGATVKEKGGKKRTTTDINGMFTLQVIKGTLLEVSYVGYQTKELKAEKADLTIILYPQKVSRNDVIITGYGAKKKDVSSKVAAEAIQGRIAGIQVTSTEGSPDADVKIRVRGGSSITQQSEPMYIVDGIPVSSISNIPPGAIKSVNVLKDASSTAIYGAKGANGVVNISTNSGNGVNYYASSPIAYEPNNEEYKSFVENPFKDPKADPLSTFSLDVDAASYSNIRRMINNGQFPDKNSVRVEEMINYFSYNYAQPSGKDPVKINTEVHTCPWNSNNLLVRIGVKAKEIPSENLPASNFVFLLDVSGSMSDANKLPLVKSSIKLLTNNMRSKDRIAIVVYAGAAGVVLESTSGDDIQKINEAIERLSAGGSTAGGAGIELAYKIAQKNYIQGGNNRIILCTDGDFNVGISDEGGLERLIEAKRKTGIFLTVLGYGMGNYKDNKLQILSQKGNGNHAYIDNIQEANKVLVNEFGSTMYAVAKDVKLQVEFNPAVVSSYRLVGYETRLLNKEDFNDDTKDAGELGAGHTVTALYEIVLTGATNNTPKVDDLRYQANPLPTPDLDDIIFSNAEMMYVKLRYKPINSDTSIKMEVPVSNTIKRETPSADYLFAASTAMFAQLLKDSEFKGEASYEDVIAYANRGLGADTRGYRREFIRLVEAVNQMAK